MKMEGVAEQESERRDSTAPNAPTTPGTPKRPPRSPRRSKQRVSKAQINRDADVNSFPFSEVPTTDNAIAPPDPPRSFITESPQRVTVSRSDIVNEPINEPNPDVSVQPPQKRSEAEDFSWLSLKGTHASGNNNHPVNTRRASEPTRNKRSYSKSQATDDVREILYNDEVQYSPPLKSAHHLEGVLSESQLSESRVRSRSKSPEVRYSSGATHSYHSSSMISDSGEGRRYATSLRSMIETDKGSERTSYQQDGEKASLKEKRNSFTVRVNSPVSVSEASVVPEVGGIVIRGDEEKPDIDHLLQDLQLQSSRDATTREKIQQSDVHGPQTNYPCKQPESVDLLSEIAPIEESAQTEESTPIEEDSPIEKDFPTHSRSNSEKSFQSLEFSTTKAPLLELDVVDEDTDLSGWETVRSTQVDFEPSLEISQLGTPGLEQHKVPSIHENPYFSKSTSLLESSADFPHVKSDSHFPDNQSTPENVNSFSENSAVKPEQPEDEGKQDHPTETNSVDNFVIPQTLTNTTEKCRSKRRNCKKEKEENRPISIRLTSHAELEHSASGKRRSSFMASSSRNSRIFRRGSQDINEKPLLISPSKPGSKRNSRRNSGRGSLNLGKLLNVTFHEDCDNLSRKSTEITDPVDSRSLIENSIKDEPDLGNTAQKERKEVPVIYIRRGRRKYHGKLRPSEHQEMIKYPSNRASRILRASEMAPREHRLRQKLVESQWNCSFFAGNLRTWDLFEEKPKRKYTQKNTSANADPQIDSHTLKLMPSGASLADSLTFSMTTPQTVASEHQKEKKARRKSAKSTKRASLKQNFQTRGNLQPNTTLTSGPKSDTAAITPYLMDSQSKDRSKKHKQGNLHPQTLSNTRIRNHQQQALQEHFEKALATHNAQAQNAQNIYQNVQLGFKSSSDISATGTSRPPKPALKGAASDLSLTSSVSSTTFLKPNANTSTKLCALNDENRQKRRMYAQSESGSDAIKSSSDISTTSSRRAGTENARTTRTPEPGKEQKRRPTHDMQGTVTDQNRYISNKVPTIAAPPLSQSKEKGQYGGRSDISVNKKSTAYSKRPNESKIATNLDYHPPESRRGAFEAPAQVRNDYRVSGSDMSTTSKRQAKPQSADNRGNTDNYEAVGRGDRRLRGEESASYANAEYTERQNRQNKRFDASQWRGDKRLRDSFENPRQAPEAPRVVPPKQKMKAGGFFNAIFR